jgi:anti-sigma regulatory factor (Ser/Thr protein kinase)
MSKRAASREAGVESVREVIARLFASRRYVTSAEVADAAAVTRQAAHYHLHRMTANGLLVHEGSRRGSRYRLNALRSHEYWIEGLSEDHVWGNEKIALGHIDPDVLQGPNVLKIVHYACTEMVNNAIDHSGGRTVTVRWIMDPDRVTFEVEDDGVGAFATIREERGLASDFEAVGEISKGKQTTDPERHSGLGIFFTSRMVDRFVLSAGQLSWTVDHAIDDSALGWLDRARVGTLVRCEVRRDTTVTPKQVYDESSDPVTRRFNKTSIRVGLFREGDFVSRTEAKRIGTNLEGFDVVELDFTGVREIGQAFADQLFRVWASDNPSATLVPVHANPAIVAMIAAVDR